MKIMHVDKNHPKFVLACKKLDTYLSEVNGRIQEEYVDLNKNLDLDKIVLLEKDEQIIGCGAYKILNKKTVEMKRIFIYEEYRYHHFGEVILGELERIAKLHGYHTALVETGIAMHSAQTFYQHNGYKQIPNYGVYKKKQTSVCFQKVL